MTVNRSSRTLLSFFLSLALLGALVPASALAQDQLGDAEADELIALIEADVAQAEQQLEELRSDRLHPDVILEAVGSEPHAILDWITAETSWVPYEGALRGPSGVLMDRTGNSLDRALLLSELLTSAGHEGVSLARTTLPARLAMETVRSEITRHATATSEGPAIGEEATVHQASVRAAADELAALVGLDGTTRSGEEWDRAAEAIADHWWVQLDDGSGPIDLDPLLSADASGRPVAESTHLASELPDDVRHSVTVRVLVERLDGDGLHQEVALEEQVLTAGERPYRTLELDFDPDPGAVTLADDPDSLEDLATLPFWRPTLRVDGDQSSGEWFSTAGRLESPSQPPAVDSKLGGAAGALGGLGAADEPELEPEPGSHLTGAWIEYVIQRPGKEPRTERREIFDILAAEADPTRSELLSELAERDMTDRGLALMGATTTLAHGGAIDDAVIAEAYLRDIIDSRSGTIAVVSMAAGREDERILPSLQATHPAPIDLLLVSALRDWWSPDAASTFIGETNLISTHTVFDAADGGATGAGLTDIVANGIGVLPGGDEDPRLVRLGQGLMDTLIEHEVRADDDGFNTWARYAQRGAEDGQWALWGTPGELRGPAAEALRPGERSRIQSSLEDGHVVVAAPSPRQRGDVSFAEWWRIAADGSTLGIGYRGWGSEIADDSTVRLSQEEITRSVAKQKADRICRLWGLTGDYLAEVVIYKTVLANYGLPLHPSSRAQSACHVLG